MASAPPSNESSAEENHPIVTVKTPDDHAPCADRPSNLPSVIPKEQSQTELCEEDPKTPPRPVEDDGSNGPNPAVTSVPVLKPVERTPAKARTASVKNTHDSIDMNLARDICHNTHQGIPVPTFLQLAFGLSPDEYETLSSKIEGWGVLVEEDFADQVKLFNQAAKEEDMYEPFVKMGNMILDRAEEKKIGSRKVHLRNMTKSAMKGASATRFPDILLAAKDINATSASGSSAASSSAGGTSSKNAPLHAQPISVHNALVPFEFKFMNPLSSLGKRRCRNELTDEGGIARYIPPEAEDEEDPPNKRQKGSTAIPSSSTIGLSTMMDLFSLIDPDDERDARNYADRIQNWGRLQLGAYATELLSARGDRSYVFGVRVNKDIVTFTFYHRSAIVEAVPFQLHKDPIFLALFLTRFQQEPSTYGFNRDIGFYDPFNLDASTRKFRASVEQVRDDSNELTKKPIAFDQMEVGETVSSHRDLIGRGTSVRDVKIPGFTGPDLVVKSSWQVLDREDESDNIGRARRVIGKHAPELYARGTIGQTPVVDLLVDNCTKRASMYERRELRIIVMRKCKALEVLKDEYEFLSCIVTFAECLHSLYTAIEMLHQDISMGNLAYYDEDGTIVAVLLDFELATMPDRRLHISNHRTGTAPFMAREILDPRYRASHKLYHDLESLFYCIIWYAIGYRKKQIPPKHDPLKDWRKANLSVMLAVKKLYIEKEDERRKLEKYMAHSPVLKDKVMILWFEYNSAWVDKKPKRDYATAKAAAIKAKEEALASGRDRYEASDAYSQVLRKYDDRNGVDSTIREGLGITYKRWMNGIGMSVGDLTCACCRD